MPRGESAPPGHSATRASMRSHTPSGTTPGYCTGNSVLSYGRSYPTGRRRPRIAAHQPACARARLTARRRTFPANCLANVPSRLSTTVSGTASTPDVSNSAGSRSYAISLTTTASPPSRTITFAQFEHSVDVKAMSAASVVTALISAAGWAERRILFAATPRPTARPAATNNTSARTTASGTDSNPAEERRATRVGGRPRNRHGCG